MFDLEEHWVRNCLFRFAKKNVFIVCVCVRARAL